MNKYVDIQVLQYAVQSLSQAITNTFAMRNSTVTSIDIVKAIPTALISTSTEEVYCLRIKYADDGQTKGGNPITHVIDLALSDIIADSKLKIEIVSALPAVADAKEGILYFVSNSETEGNNLFDEYIFSNGSFELLGSTKIDLSDYYTSSKIDELLNNKANSSDLDSILSRIGVLEGSTVDTTTIDAIIIDLRKSLDEKLTTNDLTGILEDIENLKINKLDKTSLPTTVSSFINDANYITKDEEKQNNASILTTAKNYTDTEITKVNSIKAEDYYTKTQVDNKLSNKADTTLASNTKPGLLSSDLYNILSQLDPDNLGKNGEDGETPVITIDTVAATNVNPAGQEVTFSTSKTTKKFTIYNGVGIKKANINTNNHLIITTEIGNDIDCGNINSEALDIQSITVNNDGHLITTLTDGTVEDLGQVKGDKGISITSVSMNESKHMIITYSNNTSQDIGIIEGIQGKDGKGIKSCEIVSDKLVITYTDNTKFTSGVIKGDTGKGVSKVEINDNMEIIATYTDNTSEKIGNVTSPFVTQASLNDEGELIFTYNDGTTTNEGKINGIEGASIREYTNLELNQSIKGGCYLIYNNQLYRVDSDFNCTKDFWFDSDLHMTKLSTDTQIHDLYNDYVQTTDDNPILSFEDWFSKWLVNITDQPIVAEAKISIPNRLTTSLQTLNFTESTDKNIFIETGSIVLPHDGSFILVGEIGKINVQHNNRKYIGIFNKTKNKMVAYKTSYPMDSLQYIFDSSFTQIISGVQGEEFQIQYASGTTCSNVVASELPRVALYRLTYTQPIITPDDMYETYKTHEENPLSYDDWIKSIFQRDQCRMVGSLEEELTSTSKFKLLTSFEYNKGSKDLMPKDGIFTAPYSGLYYLRLQIRFSTPKNYPSRLYLVKNFIFGETGYSAHIVAQATDGYTTNTDYVEGLNTVFWLNKDDYFTLGFESTAALNNTLYTMADGFEYGLLSSGIGGGSSEGGSANILSYRNLSYDELVRKDTLILHNNRIYVVTQDFNSTQKFQNDSQYLIQIYGSGNGINDYDLTVVDEEFRIGEFILHREYITVEDETGKFIKTVDTLYEVKQDFKITKNWDTDITYLKRTLGGYDDYEEVIRKLKEENEILKEEKNQLQSIIDDLSSIIDNINRKVV